MVERMERIVPVTAARDAASSGRFRPGQAVVGRVEKVEEMEGGGRTALVRAGGHIVRARLEAPLAAGRMYLFEMKENGGNVYWKAIPLSGREPAVPYEDAIRRWQQAWKLPEAALPVLRQALKAGAALTKEEAAELAATVRKTGQPAEAEEVLAYLFHRRLPPSSAMFRALWAARTGEPLASQLGRLKAALAAHSLSPMASAFTQAADRLLSPPLFAYEAAVRLLLAAEEGTKGPAHALLSRLGLVPLPAERMASLQKALLQRQFAEVGKLLSLPDEEAFFARFVAVDAAYKSGALSEAEAKLWMSVRAAGDPALSLFHWLRRIVGRLGLEDEAMLAGAVKTGGSLPMVSSLRRLLLHLLSGAEGKEAKAAAAVLLDRLDGMVVIAGSDGPLGHVWLSFPCPLGGQNRDFSVYWQGRRKDGGVFDPDYSRIVCSVTLEELGEMLVDMRVQRRIVHISVFHDDPRLPELAHRFAPLVKERLQAHGYLLSGIDVKAAGAGPPAPSVLPFAARDCEVDWRI
ncbi:hypothetical protein M493_06130 [Geobacillus genomosp. 3]|uniref:Cytosolic protein n=1 Tax=Geobacillus genomosp. 3 TaxID=1921421 RepID=S5Z3F2_GEOG3|nr:hypothetical protein [Geobacillus genomosp. 3]AGT31522.1 hypothetical protein M493_06130 [Geobacillus genomosp. 3]